MQVSRSLEPVLNCPSSYKARFWRRVYSYNGCLLFGAVEPQNVYSVVKIRGRQHSAHRVALAWHTGWDGNGAFALHRCGVRNCVNPKHLYWGSHLRNMQDRAKASSEPYGSITAEGAKTVWRRFFYWGETQKQIAVSFGVSKAAVQNIVDGRAYGYATASLHYFPRNMRSRARSFLKQLYPGFGNTAPL